jgi:hypothetical protein
MLRMAVVNRYDRCLHPRPSPLLDRMQYLDFWDAQLSPDHAVCPEKARITSGGRNGVGRAHMLAVQEDRQLLPRCFILPSDTSFNN